MRTRLLAVLVILLALTGGVAYAAHVLTLDAGDSVAIRCNADVLQVTQDNPVSALAICSANATSTPIPVDTATPEPTATPTMDHSGHGDPADLVWHAPGIGHGDRPPHEHGDAPPAWLTNTGVTPMYTHPGGTPNENHPYWKHTAFKGYAFNLKGQDGYCVFHLDFNPGGHGSRFHSYQCWIKDPTGAISHFNGWLDFGVNQNTGPNFVAVCGQASNVRPIIMANQRGCNPVLFETWYARAGGSGNFAPDFGFSVSPSYYAGGDPNDPATWVSVNPWPNNLTRRVEIAIPADRLAAAPKGVFWATQWGQIVSGPADPICGTPRAFGERTYTTVCLEQTIQPTLQPIVFPGNAIERTFPDDGVEFPN